jgi:hypothetical protein
LVNNDIALVTIFGVAQDVRLTTSIAAFLSQCLFEGCDKVTVPEEEKTLHMLAISAEITQ